MPGYRTHVLTGIILFPVVFLLYEFLYKIFIGDIFSPTVNVFIVSYFAYILGTDIPDIDSEVAPMRWFIHSLFPLIFFYIFWEAGYLEILNERFGDFFGVFLFVVLCVFSGFLSGYLLKFLSHRGVVHTMTFAVSYGVLCGVITGFMEVFNLSYRVFIGFSGFSGVAVHLLLDYKGFKAFKHWW